MAFINLADVRPWWLRFLLLLLIGSPMVTSGALHGQLHDAHFFNDLGAWTAYAVFIWLFVGVCVGLPRLIDWLTVATISALTILVTGALLRKFELWQTLERWAGSTTDPHQSLIDLVFRFIMILASTPFALLFVSSFPAADLMRWVSRQGASRSASLGLIAAIFLRMLQNVGEVVSKSMVAWKEENPVVILPRFRADWAGSPVRKLGVFEWLKIAISAWCATIAIQSLSAVPTVVRDFRRAKQLWHEEAL